MLKFKLFTLAFFSLWCARCGTGLQLLIFGDSIDRYMTADYCEAMRGLRDVGALLEEGWGTSSLRYELSSVGRVSSLICTCSYRASDGNDAHSLWNDSMAFAQFFGSRSHGPYQVSNAADPLVDTEPRMAHAWSTYVNRFGYPDILQLHFSMWETLQLVRHEAHSEANILPGDPFYERSMHAFEGNMRERILQAQRLAAERVRLIDTDTDNNRRTMVRLRTAVVSYTSSAKWIAHGFNEILRRLAREMSVALLDTHHDIWSLADWKHEKHKQMFRGDDLHLNYRNSVYAAMKAMHVAYSKFAYSPPDISGSSLKIGGQAAVVLPGQGVWLLVPEGLPTNCSADILKHAYLYNFHSRTKHGGLSSIALEWLRLGPSDVMEVPHSWLQNVPSGPPFEVEHLTSCNIIFSTLPEFFSGYWFSNMTRKAHASASASASYTVRVQWVLIPAEKMFVRVESGVLADKLAAFFNSSVSMQDLRYQTSAFQMKSRDESGTGRGRGKGDVRSCLHYPSESASMFPLWSFSPFRDVLADSPYAMNPLGGLLVRMDGQIDIYVLERGHRKKVTWDEIDATGKNHVTDVHVLKKWVALNAIPEEMTARC